MKTAFAQTALALLVWTGLVSSPTLGATSEPADTTALYQKHCDQCHGPDRLGLMGPALLPENLKRVRKADAAEVIANGLAATQMRPF